MSVSRQVIFVLCGSRVYCLLFCVPVQRRDNPLQAADFFVRGVKLVSVPTLKGVKFENLGKAQIQFRGLLGNFIFEVANIFLMSI